MDERFSRIKILVGEKNIKRLNSAKVTVLGVGGVGGSAVEALVRSGISNIKIVDSDIVTITNINRQIIALTSTIGKKKVDVMRDRILDINPNCNVESLDVFVTNENVDDILKGSDYVLDCIDTVSAKLDVIEYCVKNGIKVISAMGAGNKLDPTSFEVSDISKTSMCPLAKVMRRELKNRGINHVNVVWSKEKPIEPMDEVLSDDNIKSTLKAKRKTPGSTAFVPPVSGMIMASKVVRDLMDM